MKKVKKKMLVKFCSDIPIPSPVSRRLKIIKR